MPRRGASATLSSREFNQDTGRAKRAARRGPVIITDRGRPSHVLLTFDDYQRLAGGQGSIIDLLGLPSGVEDASLDVTPLRDPVLPADLGLMYLLDTNVVSELRKARAGRADRQVTAWASGVPVSDLFVSVITIQEIEVGVLLAERQDPPKGRLLRTWLEVHVLRAFADRILPIDTPIARRSAGLHVPMTRPVRDALIAATALVHGMTVVTRNVADFASTGVPIVNPWESPETIRA